MGLLDTLKKIGGGILGAVGGPIGAAVGGALAGGAGGAADERTNENAVIGQNNAANTSRYGIEQNARSNLLALQEKAALDRASLGMAAPGVRAGQVARGSIMANVQDANISHPRATIPKISGGLKPSVLSPMARQAGHELQNQAFDALQSGSDVPAMPDTASALVTPPELEDYKQPGKMETAMSTGSLIANILAALNKKGSEPIDLKGQQVYDAPAGPDDYGEYGG